LDKSNDVETYRMRIFVNKQMTGMMNTIHGSSMHQLWFLTYFVAFFPDSYNVSDSDIDDMVDSQSYSDSDSDSFYSASESDGDF
jgi:hypothetical protein